jgi:hypothetical protein
MLGAVDSGVNPTDPGEVQSVGLTPTRCSRAATDINSAPTRRDERSPSPVYRLLSDAAKPARSRNKHR